METSLQQRFHREGAKVAEKEFKTSKIFGLLSFFAFSATSR